ncbi:MAG: cytidine deaminase [Reyranellaceae bacterium]
MAAPDDLLSLARAMMARAHAPYSSFQVGAAIRAEDGTIYGGCNVENAAYPQGWCAEASAIAAMVGAGRSRIVEAVVIGGGEALCTPCGGCRQKLREFAGDDLPIHVCGPGGWRRSFTLGELLPFSFGPHNL